MGRLALVGALVVLLAAGCGGSSSKYTADKTSKCLSSEDARISSPSGDFVASTATGGAFVANLGDNWVTVSFGDQEADAEDLQVGYQRLAASNVRANINDVLSRYHNAVLLWHKHPGSADLALVTGCLG